MGVVRFRVDGAVLRAAGRIAALGLHGAEVSLAHRLLRPESVAVGDLVEAVLHGLRADLNRLEEDVVLRVTRHWAGLLLTSGGEGILQPRSRGCKQERQRGGCAAPL